MASINTNTKSYADILREQKQLRAQNGQTGSTLQPTQAPSAISQEKALEAAQYAAKPATAQAQNNGAPSANYRYTPSNAVQAAQQMLTDTLNNKPGEYGNRYQDQLQGLLDKITNRPAFTYDVSADPVFQIYRDMYMTDGRRAMQDTIGQAAALTGGYGNSYAMSAGQQMYNQHLENLYGLVPQLQQQAYQRYADEGDRLAQNYQLLNQAENQDYSRYRDEYADWMADRQMAENAFNTERGFDYNAFGDQRNYEMQMDQFDRNLAWQKEQFAQQTDQFDRNLAWQKEQFAQQMALQQAQFEWQKAQAAAKAVASGGSGSRSRSSGSSSGSKSSGSGNGSAATAKSSKMNTITGGPLKPVEEVIKEYNLVPEIMTARTFAQVDPLQKMYADIAKSNPAAEILSGNPMIKRYNDYAQTAIDTMYKGNWIDSTQKKNLEKALDAELKMTGLSPFEINKIKSTTNKKK